MANDKVLTGAIALIKSANGTPIGKMKNISYAEDMRRIPVRGIGTILPSEQAVVEWDGSITCDFYEIAFEKTGIPGAIRRDMGNVDSQASIGEISFEDQLILNTEGVALHIFKKISDIIDPKTKLIKPKVIPYAIITSCLITADSFEIAEGSVSGHRQAFKCLKPIMVQPNAGE